MTATCVGYQSDGINSVTASEVKCSTTWHYASHYSTQSDVIAYCVVYFK